MTNPANGALTRQDRSKFALSTPQSVKNSRLTRYFSLANLFPLFLGSLLALAACHHQEAPQTPPLSPVRQAEQTVLHAHDSLMTRTGSLFRLRQQLQKRQLALSADSDQAAAKARLRRVRTATAALQGADDAMLDWMHQYHAPPSTALPDSALAYFRRQSILLTSLGERTRAAEDSATAVLRTLSD